MNNDENENEKPGKKAESQFMIKYPKAREEFNHYFSQRLLDQTISDLLLTEMYLKTQPPVTRWRKIRGAINWEITKARIWLSKLIYDWD